MILLNSCGLNTKRGTEQITSYINSSENNKSILMKRILIVTPGYGLTDDSIITSCVHSLGFSSTNVFLSDQDYPANGIDYIYIGEGNTYEYLYYIQKNQLFDYIKERVKNNSCSYIGSSAGAILAGSPDILICNDFDTNIVGHMDSTALQLINGTVLPHANRDDLMRYIECKDPYFLSRYEHIYNISNDDVLVFNNQ